MTEKEKLSQTMRIDLIPEAPAAPATGKQVVVSAPTRRQRRVQISKKTTGKGSDAKYRELLQGLYDAALISSVDGRIGDVNLRAVEKLGYSREELCALSVFDIILGADASLLTTLLENLENDQFTLQRTNGDTEWLRPGRAGNIKIMPCAVRILLQVGQ